MKISIPGLDKVETGREPLPAGRYTVKLTSAEKKKALSGEGEYIAWQGTVQGGDHNGRILFWNTSLKESALWNLKGLLDAASVDMDAEGFATEDALGKDVEIQVDMDEYQGRPTNRVNATYYPVSE